MPPAARRISVFDLDAIDALCEELESGPFYKKLKSRSQYVLDEPDFMRLLKVVEDYEPLRREVEEHRRRARETRATQAGHTAAPAARRAEAELQAIDDDDSSGPGSDSPGFGSDSCPPSPAHRVAPSAHEGQERREVRPRPT